MEAVLAILMICLGVAGVVYCVVKPRYAIVPVLLLFPIEQNVMGYLPTLRYQFGWLVNVVIGSIAVLGVGYHFFRGEKVFQGLKNRVFISLIAMYAYILVSTFWTSAPDSAAFFINTAWPYFVLWYLVSPLLTTRLEDLESVVVPLIFACTVLMALMLINPAGKFIYDRYVIDLGYQVGQGKLRSNPLAIADAGAALAITAALYRPNKFRPTLLILQAGAVLLGLTLALMSGSRGQVVGAVALIAVMLPFVKRSKNVLRLVGGTVVVFVVIGFLYFVFQSFVTADAQTRWTGSDQSGGLGMRMQMAGTALSAYANNPAYWPTGLGAAAFNTYFTFRSGLELHWYPHNILVEALTEYGIPGIVLMGVIVVGTFKSSVRLYNLAGASNTRRTTSLIFGSLALFYFAMSLKQGALLGAPPVFMYCLIIARVAKNEELAAAALPDEAELENTENAYADEAAANDGWGPAPEHEPEPA